MQAIVVRQFGAPEVLRLEELPTPQPAPDEVLIKVHSVSVNRTLDCIVRAGHYPVKVQLPQMLGADPAGEVVEVGIEVEEHRIGERVAGISATPCQKCS